MAFWWHFFHEVLVLDLGVFVYGSAYSGRDGDDKVNF